MNQPQQTHFTNVLCGVMQHLNDFLQTRRVRSAFFTVMLLDHLSQDMNVHEELRSRSAELADAVESLWREQEHAVTPPAGHSLEDHGYYV